MNIRRMIANWWRDIFAEPASLGRYQVGDTVTVDGQKAVCVYSSDHSADSRDYTLMEGMHALPTVRAPRMMFPATGWNVGKDGPNVPAEPDHYTKLRNALCELDWDVLLDACDIPVPRPVLRGAAFNESAKYLQRCGYFTSGWVPTDEGRKAADSELIRRRG